MGNNFELTVPGARGSMPVNGKNFSVYGGATSCYRIRAGLTVNEALDRLISPPFRPLKVGQYPANVIFHELPEKNFSLGAVDVEFMEGTHPLGSTIYRLTYRGKSLVYATDFEHTPEGCDALIRFAAGCDVLLYDAQYTDAEYEKFRGYGHSTATVGFEVGKAARAKKNSLRTPRAISDGRRAC